ncbi:MULTISPECIES: Gp19/Gp15/Gp42 family protein [Gordonibacter]|uniref:Gp19/Gp15/Gp42 family protein n=1 Tax=Gordonibacter faecis TaxID=3047475 RepID=A0ABT7DQ00_9ACTN|nr:MULTISPECIES: Gp19/Gp15/Gp42 family protein [unclassified Gordonibacter]MDJ1651630.1 Gp19/Gp15/Gp42 family protein [Gordonibacter sp. KGMB12511]HIW77052.1 phage Gp19/Gp15/Gp42 family protein [Candidatus Gordonibacter avicola]
MEAFATIEDLQARWRTLTADEQARATAKLADASVIIATECQRAGVDVADPDELTAANLCLTTCEMVKRAMLAGTDQVPMSSYNITAGPFSEQQTFVNPSGDLYLTSKERARLGINRQRAGSIMPNIGGVP